MLDVQLFKKVPQQTMGKKAIFIHPVKCEPFGYSSRDLEKWDFRCGISSCSGQAGRRVDRQERNLND